MESQSSVNLDEQERLAAELGIDINDISLTAKKADQRFGSLTGKDQLQVPIKKGHTKV